MPARQLLGALAAAALLAALGCRGGISSKPPVHLVQDMDFQPKYRAQGESKLLPHGMATQLPPAGTVARGTVLAVPARAYLNADGSFATAGPEPATPTLFERGRTLFNVHCAPCHDRTGSGQGLVAKRWPVPVPSFYAADRADMPLGRVVKAITDGFNTMPSYAHQVDVKDRWAIAHYVRALQYRMNVPKD